MAKSIILKRCNITQDEINNLGYNLEDLENIYKDFKKKQNDYSELGQYIVKNFLQNHEYFHSIKFRVKSPESLIKKIIKKNKKGISVKDYEKKITDILGIRILLLDKDDRKVIHNFISGKREITEKIAYISSEKDNKSYNKFFSTEEIKQKDGGYSSLHYIIKTKPTKQELSAEIQVRSLLEEAWGEIDHLMRYKNDPHPKQNALNIAFQTLHTIATQGNEIISLLNRFYKKKPYLKDIIKIISIIDASEIPLEEKIKLKNQLNNNTNISFSEFLSNNLYQLSGIDALSKISEQFLSNEAINNMFESQRKLQESFNKIILPFNNLNIPNISNDSAPIKPIE